MTLDVDFDREALQRLVALGGDKLVHRIVAIFASFGAARLEDAEEALARGDYAAMAAAAHAMRSSAGNVGALRLLATATELEHAARARHADLVAPLVHTMRRTYDAAREQLLAVLPGVTP